MNIPRDLIEVDAWVVWRGEPVATRPGKWTKIPYHATDRSRKASVTDPSTWSTFAQAYAAYQDDLAPGLPLDELPASWDVTSDSIAAWVAGRVGAGRLVLVKAVDGRFADLVDEHLPTMLERARFETWVIGGCDPARVRELLERGTTAGTRIGPLLPWPHG